MPPVCYPWLLGFPTELSSLCVVRGACRSGGSRLNLLSCVSLLWICVSLLVRPRL